jgi:hypothetical protein
VNYGQIFKDAWRNVRTYRALWVFGLILALTAVSLETVVFYGLDDDDDGDRDRRGITIVTQEDENFYEAFRRTIRQEIDALDVEISEANREIDAFFAREFDVQVNVDIFTIFIVLLAVSLIGYLLAKIAGYVSEVALIRMVDEDRRDGVRYSVRAGFRLGWSYKAWRIFLIDLLVNVAAVLGVFALLLLVAAPLALWATGNTPAGVVGTVIAVILFFPSLVLVVVALATLSMLKQFFRRACVLENLGVIASIRHGYRGVRQHVKEVLPVWLVTIGVNFAWPLVMAPVAILMVLVALLLGVLVALLLGGLASFTFAGATPWVVAAATGIPVFILTLALPLAFLGGLREVFLSSAWTLTYRDLEALEDTESTRVRDLGPSNLETAALA